MSYQIGTCYGCQKCLYCGIIEDCECDKTIKPTKKNRTEE
ncbi:27423_t:CDS:2 [Dentiscutata erythropus]|uniref:27423_t:CDS:1 n=1 Tax=Dentiscutata erythropus TaxID=1348616 RepID=A0A9N9CZW4_9GLOM|nr:27423_t:CDS:2 [Dentiscutata erythropus]